MTSAVALPVRPSPADVLTRLRGDSSRRPVVDPGLAGGLRDWLEDGLAPALAALPPGAPSLRVNKETLNQVLACEAHLVARRSAPRALTGALVRGILVDAVFRQWVTMGHIGDPFTDAVAAVACEGDRDEVAGFVAALPADERHQLAEEVADHARTISTTWQVPSSAWLPRTQERLEVPLAGGRVVLTGVVDLALGAPAGERASVCVVEVKSGSRRLEHRGDLHFYALLETLRSGAPPFRIATYYTRTGELDAEDVGEDAIVGALHRLLAGVDAVCRMAGGAEPARNPNPLCAWCAGLPDCGPGQDRVSRTPHHQDDEL